MRRRAARLVAIAILSCVAARAQEQNAGTDEHPVVDHIDVIVENVFEDGGLQPEGWVYRVGNGFHIKTRERIIRQELLFAVGEPVTPEDLAQTERNLRALPFLRLARVESVPSGEGRVRVRVTASDSWSTLPVLRFEKVGNRWIWRVGGAEQNLLGYGKQLRIERSSDLDRDQTFAFYRDPRLFGSRFSTSVLLSNASDGHQVGLAAVRPFYELGTRYAVRAQLEDFDRLDPIYEDGVRVDRLRHTRRRLEGDYGIAIRRTMTTALRVHAGYDFSEDEIAEGLDLRRFGIARVGVSSVGHRFLKLTHVNRFERPEDINLGARTSAFFGVSTPALGGEDQVSTFYWLNATRGFALGDGGFLLGTASWQARRRNESFENSFALFRVNAVQKLALRKLVLAKAELRYGSDLDPEVQVRLGAESGLRGYPVRQFNGDRALLFSLEGRWFFVDDVVNLVSAGVAAFVDSGYAWPVGEPMRLGDLRSNLGASLLLGLSRGEAGRPGIRIDVAYALQPIEGRSPWLVSFGSRIGF